MFVNYFAFALFTTKMFFFFVFIINLRSLEIRSETVEQLFVVVVVVASKIYLTSFIGIIYFIEFSQMNFISHL